MACAGISFTRKKGPEGPRQKSSRQARTMRPRAHATRYEDLHFYVTKAALSLLVEIAAAPHSRDSRKSYQSAVFRRSYEKLARSF